MICLFLDGEPSLLLSSVKRDSEGRLKSGVVQNGGWNFEIRKYEALAKAGNSIVTRWPLPDYTEMEIPAHVRGGYNTIMEWARQEYNGVNKNE